MRERSQRFDPRQTMQRDTCEVFHYREPRPAGVEVHHHDFYEVYYLLGGQVEYWVDGRIIRMLPGDLLLINPLELHRPIPAGESRMYERIVLWINKEYLESLHAGKVNLSSCFDVSLPTHTHLIRPAASERTALTARMGELVREFYSREFGSDLSAYGLFLQFMVQLNRMALHTEHQEEAEERSDLVQQVLGYIGQNLSSPLSLAEIADKFYVSKYHLAHAFGSCLPPVSQQGRCAVAAVFLIIPVFTGRLSLSMASAPGLTQPASTSLIRQQGTGEYGGSKLCHFLRTQQIILLMPLNNHGHQSANGEG